MIPSTQDEQTPSLDFANTKVGIKTLNDAIIELSNLCKINPRLAKKEDILKAIGENNVEQMRQISDFFYRTSGIYSRLCRYMAYLYKYDWMIVPYVVADSIKPEKVIEGFDKALRYLDNFEVKKFFSDVALKVIRHGVYYGYLVEGTDRMNVQELPIQYCRSRFSSNGRPAVEFNMKYFDNTFKDTEQRMRILKLFPDDFKKGYIAFKEGRLPPQFQGDTAGWYLLDTDYAFKFNINNEDFPLLISVIPAIIDLDEAQELDRKRMAQQLLKIVIQKMPIDKNGDLVFDVDEAAELHNNAVRMLARAIGIDVLTTFADVSVEDMSDSAAASKLDELEKVERTVYNESGTAQNLFNTNGNIALEKSILNDEASIYNLILQFEAFLNFLLRPYNKQPKKLYYKAQILPTTIYNYKDLVKLYKEQTQIGYSKFLPAIALGESQSTILATNYFENQILDLVHKFIPPMSSNTMNADSLAEISNSDKKVGRTEKSDEEKSDKTLKNLESQS